MSLATSRVALFDVSTGISHPIVDSAAFGRYSPTGHVVFERRGRLEAAPYSLREHRLTASPRPILRGLATADATVAGPRFAFSRTGSLIYVPGTSSEIDERLHWLDTRGRLEPIPIPPVALGAVDVSPDAQRLAMTVESEDGADLWLGDMQRGGMSRLSADGRSVSPTWRPNGLEIAFAYSKAGPFNLFIRPTDSDLAPRPLLESPWNQFPTSWSPDGGHLAFTEFQPLTGADIWVLESRDPRASSHRPHVVRRIACAVFARRQVARLHVERIWSMGSVRSSGRRHRPSRACVTGRRRLALLVGRWAHLVLQRQWARGSRRHQHGANADGFCSPYPPGSGRPAIGERSRAFVSCVGATKRRDAGTTRVAGRARVVRRADPSRQRSSAYLRFADESVSLPRSAGRGIHPGMSGSHSDCLGGCLAT